MFLSSEKLLDSTTSTGSHFLVLLLSDEVSPSRVGCGDVFDDEGSESWMSVVCTMSYVVLPFNILFLQMFFFLFFSIGIGAGFC